MARKLGSAAQKALLLLAGGLSLGLAGSPTTYFKIIKAIARDWKKIDEEELRQAIKNLYRSKLVSYKKNEDGSYTIVITRKGQNVALSYKIENIKVPLMKKWDGKWRIIVFDIPEKYRNGRDALRRVLKQIGFFEYQKSVFVHPFECQNEIDFVVEFFNLRPWARIVVAESIDDELRLKRHFNL